MSLEEFGANKKTDLLRKLQEAADRFLACSYNTLMSTLATTLQPGLSMSTLDKEDFLRFFRLVHFFTRYTSLKQVERFSNFLTLGCKKCIIADSGWSTHNGCGLGNGISFLTL